MTELARKLADNGAKLLDEKVEDWYCRVNSDRLDIAHPELCVLGQVFDEVNGFAIGMRYLFEDDWVYQMAVEHGFTVTSYWTRASYDVKSNFTQAKTDIENAWRDIIEERLQANARALTQ